MVVKKLVLACVLINCAHELETTPRTKFSFTKTFVTPKKTYEERLAELDKHEVLERCNFSSDEDDAEDPPPRARTKHDNPKSVAKAQAQIVLRIGESRDTRSPALQQRFVEMPGRREWPFPPDSAPPVAFFPHAASCCNFRPDIFAPCPCMFPPAYVSSDDEPDVKNTETDKSTAKDPTVMYFFHGDKDGRFPTREEMRKTRTGELTLDDLDFIEDITGDDVGDEYDAECSDVTEASTLAADDVAETQANTLSDGKLEEITPVLYETVTEEDFTTPSSLCLYQTNFPPDPLYYLDDNDILISEITSAPPCPNNSANANCMQISDNLIFKKINISDLAGRNVSYWQSFDEVCGNYAYDMDDLMCHTLPCSLPPSSLYPSWSHKKFIMSLYAPYFKPWSSCGGYDDKAVKRSSTNT